MLNHSKSRRSHTCAFRREPAVLSIGFGMDGGWQGAMHPTGAKRRHCSVPRAWCDAPTSKLIRSADLRAPMCRVSPLLPAGVAPRRSRGGGGATDPRHQQHTDSFDPQQDFSTDPDLNDDDDDAGGWRAPSGDSDDLAPVSAAAALGEDGSTAAAAASLIIFTKRR